MNTNEESVARLDFKKPDVLEDWEDEIVARAKAEFRKDLERGAGGSRFQKHNIPTSFFGEVVSVFVNVIVVFAIFGVIGYSVYLISRLY